MRGRWPLVPVGLALALPGCGAGSDEHTAARSPTPVAGRKLERNGISITLPERWDGRVMFREPTGAVGVVFQVANFELPANEGLEPPPEGPDRIKAMDGSDVLLTIGTDEAGGVPARGRIGLDDLRFLAPGAPRVPVGHALAEGNVCLRSRCFGIAVDFASGPAQPALTEGVDEVLASVAVEGVRAIERDGLRLELPASWHGYATTVGPDGSQPVIWAANVPFRETPSTPSFPRETLRLLPPTGLAVEAVAAPSTGPRSSLPFTSGDPVELDRPPRLADGFFLSDGYEGQQAPHVSTQIVEGRSAKRTFYVQVYFGRNRPTDDMRAAVDRVLASFSLDPSR
jgi:hypothetical protein